MIIACRDSPFHAVIRRSIITSPTVPYRCKAHPELVIAATEDERLKKIRTCRRSDGTTPNSMKLQQTSVDASGLLMGRPNSFHPDVRYLPDAARRPPPTAHRPPHTPHTTHHTHHTPHTTHHTPHTTHTAHSPPSPPPPATFLYSNISTSISRNHLSTALDLHHRSATSYPATSSSS